MMVPTLGAAADESGDMGGTEETMAVYPANNGKIAGGELNGRNPVNAVEAGEAWRRDLATISGVGRRKRGEGLLMLAR